MIEILILYVLNKRERTLYSIRKDIIEIFGTFTKPSIGTIYPALKRLLKEDAVSVYDKMSEGGKKSTYYSITKAGYKSFGEISSLKAGDKVYFINREKNIILYHIGKRPLVDGMNILGAHIDSPRLDLKQNPLYESKGFALMDTHYYGGVKKYQYVAMPLALHGVICKKNGEKVYVSVGENEFISNKGHDHEPS